MKVDEREAGPFARVGQGVALDDLLQAGFRFRGHREGEGLRGLGLEQLAVPVECVRADLRDAGEDFGHGAQEAITGNDLVGGFGSAGAAVDLHHLAALAVQNVLQDLEATVQVAVREGLLGLGQALADDRIVGHRDFARVRVLRRQRCEGGQTEEDNNTAHRRISISVRPSYDSGGHSRRGQGTRDAIWWANLWPSRSQSCSVSTNRRAISAREKMSEELATLMISRANSWSV